MVPHDGSHAHGLVCYSNRSTLQDSILLRIITATSKVNGKRAVLLAHVKACLPKAAGCMTCTT